MNVGNQLMFGYLISSHIHPDMKDMIIDNDPLIERNISVPRDMGGLSCSSFTAGIVEAVLDGLGFVRPITLLYYLHNANFSFTARAGNSTQHTNNPTSSPDNYLDKIRKICT